MELIKSLGGYENEVVCWLRFRQNNCKYSGEQDIKSIHSDNKSVEVCYFNRNSKYLSSRDAFE